ncbi:POTRA domain-containing protein, partial [Vibrio parahaemolyticus]
SADQYNPERVEYDKELLRRFYLEHGYADIDVTSATAELSPDRKNFFITFQINEGERYRVGKINVVSQVAKLDAAAMKPLVTFHSGAFY